MRYRSTSVLIINYSTQKRTFRSFYTSEQPLEAALSESLMLHIDLVVNTLPSLWSEKEH